MGIAAAFSFLVYPGKKLNEQPEISGTSLELSGKLFIMLDEVYQKSVHECNIEIAFRPNPRGEQQNDCRDLILAFLQSREELAGRKLAERLQLVTTQRSGLGLLFLMVGDEGDQSRLVISRFPADSGILAEQTDKALSVQFLEKIFLKSAYSYKSVLYSGKSSASDFWEGRAIDKQLNNSHVALSDYWIKEFLVSDFRTTAAAGTRRLANAIKVVTKKTKSLEVKEQLAAAAKLAKGLNGKNTSIAAFAAQLSISDDAKTELLAALPSATLATEMFTFDATEFDKHLPYHSVELDNGAVLTALTSKFDTIFIHERMGDDRVRFTTQGSIVDQSLRMKK